MLVFLSYFHNISLAEEVNCIKDFSVEEDRVNCIKQKSDTEKQNMEATLHTLYRELEARGGIMKNVLKFTKIIR